MNLPFSRFRSRTLGRVLAALTCVLNLLTTPAFGQEARPRSARSAVQTLDTVATQAMRSVDNAALQQRHPLPLGGGPLRFAEPLTTSLSPTKHGTWERLDDGTWLWRLRIRSDDALTLHLGFTTYRMPSGAELYVYSPGYESVIGPFTAADNEDHGQLWTPALPGDEAVLEVTVPAAQKSNLQLTLGQITHGFRPLRTTGAKRAAKASGACNVDVACEEADPWRNQLRAVARFTTNRGTLCTGTLINNTAGDQTPYFLAANHCGITPENAASVVVYWNFQNSFCRSNGSAGGAGDGALDESSSGAFYRASTGPSQHRYNALIQGSDFTLIELDDPIDSSFDARFAGWSRIDDAPDRSVTVHHPSGEEKRISFDFDPARITSYLDSTVAVVPTHLRVANWDVGTTEPGSSGAPLFNANQRVVGMLSGGFAECTSPTADNDRPDWYGRLAWAWDSGDTQDTRLSPWLDPLGVGATSVQGLDANERDITSPASVQDLQVTSSARDAVTLSWTATGDDGFQGTASFYDLRYATSPIESESDFDAATPIETSFVPGASGALQTASIDGLEPDQSYFFAIVTYDNAGNRSPIGTTSNETVLLSISHQLDVYPNPFRQQTTVRFAINREQRVAVEIYDALGRHVRTAYRQQTESSSFVYVTVGAGPMPSGRYFIRLVGESFAATRPVTLVR